MQSQSDGADTNWQAINHSNVVYFEGVGILILVAYTREQAASTVLTECWNWVLMLAANFGNPWTNVGGQNFGYQLFFFYKTVNQIYGLT